MYIVESTCPGSLPVLTCNLPVGHPIYPGTPYLSSILGRNVNNTGVIPREKYEEIFLHYNVRRPAPFMSSEIKINLNGK